MAVPQSLRPDRHRPGTPRKRAATTVIVSALLTVPVLPRATAAPLPSPVPCATGVSTVGTAATTSPMPLPVPTSTVGGHRLSASGLQTNLPAGAARPPAPQATAWLIADLDAGTVIAACNAHVQLAPASTLKTLTALTLAHRLNWSSRYIGQPEDVATEGTKVGITAGSTYTVRDLFHGLMLSSGNDAATALATVSGGKPTTARLMNEQAQRLGALDTHAVNDSGLDAPGQVSSAYDLALLGRAALADPLITRLVQTRSYNFPGKGNRLPRPTFQIQNHNHLLTRYPGATGVKNGYTTAAGGAFVGSASRNGHHYLVTLLNAQGSTWQQTERLLTWAFAVAPQTTPVGRLVAPGEVRAAPAGQLASTGPPATNDPGTTTGDHAGQDRTAASATSRNGDTRTSLLVMIGAGGLALIGASLVGRRGRRSTYPSSTEGHRRRAHHGPDA